MLNRSAEMWENSGARSVLETLGAPLTTQTVGGGQGMADSQRTPRFTEKQNARFWSRVQKSDGCWLWVHDKTNDGYGYFPVMRDGARERRAHRVSWEMAFGPIPAGLVVCHRCDVRLCVRPDHLFLGTPRDNQNDAIEKGRIVRSHCVRGHEFTPANTRWYQTKSGHRGRYCRACIAEHRRRENQRRRKTA